MLVGMRFHAPILDTVRCNASAPVRNLERYHLLSLDEPRVPIALLKSTNGMDVFPEIAMPAELWVCSESPGTDTAQSDTRRTYI